MFPNHGQEIKILQSHVPNLWTVLGCTIPDATPPQPIIGSKVMEMWSDGSQKGGFCIMVEFSRKGCATKWDSLTKYTRANQIISLFADIWYLKSLQIKVIATTSLPITLHITSSFGPCCVLRGPGRSSTHRCHRLDRSSQSLGKIGYDKSNKVFFL